MAATTVKFNVGGTVSEVAVSTIQSRPEGLLAKMIDGRFPCGKDESGAYFVDRNPRFFDVVLDVHRDNNVYPLAGVTRERVLAELEFYGLQDVDGLPMKRSFEETLLSLGPALSDWQREQERLGQNMLTEGFARLLAARAQVVTGPRSTTLKSCPLDISGLPGGEPGVISAITKGWKDGKNGHHTSDVGEGVAKIFALSNIKATFCRESEQVAGKSVSVSRITLEPLELGPV